jgi:hypothetical protein
MRAGIDFAFHFTEPERAEEIVRSGHQKASRHPSGRSVLYLTGLGPHAQSARELLDTIFATNGLKGRCLWGALIYRVTPGDPNGLAVYRDPRTPEWALLYECARSGFAYVYDYLLGWGTAAPEQAETQTWMWCCP